VALTLGLQLQDCSWEAGDGCSLTLSCSCSLGLGLDIGVALLCVLALGCMSLM
jgi:hypothetical protein